MTCKAMIAVFNAAAMAAVSALAGETMLLEDWAFSRGSETNSWEAVRIPHDWAISGPFDKTNDMQIVAIKEDGETVAQEKTGRTGALPWIGEAWYRREVEVSEGVDRVSVFFGGVMSEPEVYWDGVKVGEWKYGYNMFEVAVPAESGKHTLMVHCLNRPESSRWYPGAGIYRPVWLWTGGEIAIDPWGQFVRTTALKEDKSAAFVTVNTLLRGGEKLSKNRRVEVKYALFDADGKVVAERAYLAGRSPEAVATLRVEAPKLWTPETPYLYTLVTEVWEQGAGNTGDRTGNTGHETERRMLDLRKDKVGIRTVAVTPEGFRLNGQVRKIKGVCLHHDLGAIGAEFNESAFRRQVRKLKWLGCDAIRTSHNMPERWQMDICDEEGMMVMAESFDVWATVKVKNGYNLFFKEWHLKDIENLVRAHRNHPSIVMWSIGNEIPDQDNRAGLYYAREMQSFIHSLDTTRPVTQGMQKFDGSSQSGVFQAMGLPGQNYHLNRYKDGIDISPVGVILGSETASTVSSRGCYHFPVEQIRKRAPYHADGQCSSYDVECCAWANLPDDDWAWQEKDEVVGEFVWTGFDYLGEPSPYNEYWPSRSSYFGIFDLAGLPKDRAWLYRSRWNTKERTLHIVPHWTWGDQVTGNTGQRNTGHGTEKHRTEENGERIVPVYVYTDAPEAELFVNGKSQGVRRKDASSRLDRYRLRWNDVVYEPGEVKVVAHYPDGTTEEAAVCTAGEPAQIAIKAEPSYAKPTDLTPALRFFEASIVDKDGNLCPDAAIPLTCEVSGAACFKGVCNGDATSLEVFTEPKMTTFHGQLVVVVEPTSTGPAKLTVKGGGLEGATDFIIN